MIGVQDPRITEVVSTETLVRTMAAAMNLRARVVHLPEWLLEIGRAHV